MSASLHEGVAGLSAIEGCWRALSAAAPDDAAFLGYGFAFAAARYHEERGERVLVASVATAGRTACLLPVAVSRRGGVSVAAFLGDPVAQYGDALLAAGAPKRLADLALETLLARTAVDVFALRRVREDAAIRPALDRLARRQTGASEAPYAELDPSAASAALLQAAGSKHRREQARCQRRLSEFGEPGFGARRGPEAVDWLREAFAMKAARLAGAGFASPVVGDPHTVLAFERAAQDPGEAEAVTAFRLTVGGRSAAFEIGIVRGRRYHAYLGVTSAVYAAASPGRILMGHVLDWCAENGVETADMLPPADPYKRLWTSGAVKVHDYVAPTSLKGALYAGPWLSVVRPRLRKALDSLPPGLRRGAGAAALWVGAR